MALKKQVRGERLRMELEACPTPVVANPPSKKIRRESPIHVFKKEYIQGQQLVGRRLPSVASHAFWNELRDAWGRFRPLPKRLIG